MNRITHNVAQYEAAIEKARAEGKDLTSMDEMTVVDDVFELMRFKDLNALAGSDPKQGPTVEEAQTVYVMLGGESVDVDAVNALPLAQRLTLINVFKQYLEHAA